MNQGVLKQVLGHLLFWVLVMLTYAISEWGYRDNFAQAMLFEFVYLPPRLIAVYVNWFILIPRLLYQNRIFGYLCFLILLLFVLAAAQRYFTIYWAYPKFFPEWNYQNWNPFEFFRIVQNLVLILAPVAFSTGIKIFLDWFDQKNKAQQLEVEKTEAELKYLKSQVNPHFLFNALNSIYGLSLEKSNKVPKLLLRLSDFLSYSLYESSTSNISLKKEIDLINNYIALEKERYEDKVNIEWNIQKGLPDEVEIAPLLLIPLVENAFKHGVKEATEKAAVWINLAQRENQLLFEVRNTVPERLENTGKGIGLKNLKKRLAILYPGRHELHVGKSKEGFSAKLVLEINNLPATMNRKKNSYTL